MKNEQTNFDASTSDVTNWINESGIYDLIFDKSEEVFETYGEHSMCPIFTVFHDMMDVLIEQGWTVEDLNSHISEHYHDRNKEIDESINKAIEESK